jgi:hypothetical protein
LSQEAADTPLLSWLQTIPDIGRAFLSFIFEPSTFGHHWMANPSGRPSSWTALGSCLTTSAVLYGAYALIAKKSVLRGLDGQMPPENQGAEERVAKPRIASVSALRHFVRSGPTRLEQGIEKNFGLGFELPESGAKGLNVPQRLLLHVAWSDIVLEDVVPNSFTAKSTKTLFLVTLALVAAFCSFLPAWGLGTSAAFADVLPLTVVGMAFWFFYLSITFFVVATVFGRFLPERQADSGCAWLLLLFALAVGVPSYSFYESFKVVYAFSNFRMCLCLLAGIILSAYIAPIVFVPACYVWLKIGSLIDKLI